MAASVPGAACSSVQLASKCVPAVVQLSCRAFSTRGPQRLHLLSPPCSVAAPSRPGSATTIAAPAPDVLDARQYRHSEEMNFHEYAQATQMLQNLKGQTSDLELLLAQMNDLEIDDTLLAPPEDREARKAKRAAKRAERKAKTGHETSTASVSNDAAVAGSRASSSTQADAASSSAASRAAPPAPPLTPSTSSSDVQHLEELFKLTTPEPELPSRPSASILTPRKSAPRRPAPAAAPLPVQPVMPPAAAPVEQDLLQPPSMSEQPSASISAPAVLRPKQPEQRPGRPTPSSAPPAPAVAAQAAPALATPAASASVLEASAAVARSALQASTTMPAGPSLLSLAPAASQRKASTSGTARARQSRRSAHYASRHDVAAMEVGDDSASSSGQGLDGLLGKATTVLDSEKEREVTEVCRDFLLLEKVKRQCQKMLQRPPQPEEVAAAVGMELGMFRLRYDAGLRAKELLLKTNYKLVVTVCKAYIGKGATLQDLVSEGLKGLLRGVEKYDGSKGFRFSTYAHWWIRQAVSRSLVEQNRVVRLPVHMIEQLMKVKNASRELRTQLGREPTTDEIAAKSGFEAARIETLLAAAQQASSLDMPMMDDDNASSAKDQVEDDGPDADQVFQVHQMKRDLEQLLTALSEREATVVRLRFGLEDGREWTLEEIGERLAVTRERIRQIEAKALRKLKVLTVSNDGVLNEYGQNLSALGEREFAARTSSGTKKTK